MFKNYLSYTIFEIPTSILQNFDDYRFKKTKYLNI